MNEAVGKVATVVGEGGFGAAGRTVTVEPSTALGCEW